jgi:hypothetical protein
MRATFIVFLTVALGIVPATLLVFWAVILGVVSVTALFEFGHPATALRGLLLTGAAVLSLFGYVALFYAASDAVTPRVARWLVAGIIANLVGVGLLVGEPEYLEPSVLFMVFSPLVVGCAHLARFIILTRQRRVGV